MIETNQQKQVTPTRIAYALKRYQRQRQKYLQGTQHSGHKPSEVESTAFFLTLILSGFGAISLVALEAIFGLPETVITRTSQILTVVLVFGIPLLLASIRRYYGFEVVPSPLIKQAFEEGMENSNSNK